LIRIDTNQEKQPKTVEKSWAKWRKICSEKESLASVEDACRAPDRVVLTNSSLLMSVEESQRLVDLL